MARGSLAGLPSVAREATDPGAGWQQVPWTQQGNRHFQIGGGAHLKLRREEMQGAVRGQRLAAAGRRGLPRCEQAKDADLDVLLARLPVIAAGSPPDCPR
jgi:hypothetical protein